MPGKVTAQQKGEKQFGILVKTDFAENVGNARKQLDEPRWGHVPEAEIPALPKSTTEKCVMASRGHLYPDSAHC